MSSTKKQSSLYLIEMEKETKKLLRQLGIESPPVSDDSDVESDLNLSSESDNEETEMVKKKENNVKSKHEVKNSRSMSEKKTKDNEVDELKKVIIELRKTVNLICLFN